MKQSTVNKYPKFVSLLFHLQESGRKAEKVEVTDEMIDDTLKEVRNMCGLTNEDMDPTDIQIEDLPNRELFDKLIDPGSKLLEMVSREMIKNIHWTSAARKCPSFRVSLHLSLQ